MAKAVRGSLPAKCLGESFARRWSDLAAARHGVSRIGSGTDRDNALLDKVYMGVGQNVGSPHYGRIYEQSRFLKRPAWLYAEIPDLAQLLR